MSKKPRKIPDMKDIKAQAEEEENYYPKEKPTVIKDWPPKSGESLWDGMVAE